MAKYGQKEFRSYVGTRGGIVPKLPSASKNTNQRLGNWLPRELFNGVSSDLHSSRPHSYHGSENYSPV